MSPFSKIATTTLITMTVLSLAGHAGAAPLSSSLALRGSVAPALETIQWGGGGYYGYDYGYYCPPYYGYYSRPTYGYYAPTYYGGYSYGSYYRGYGYAPRVYWGYGSRY